ncbi:hypothetical protein LCGC14_2315220 [marine sediment metagenome]|uniref:Uncharacterized protein n=1 Tax=marine sediment metagenome TaxID=412755 RepID=A0A0F9FEB5_9ZZZZ
MIVSKPEGPLGKYPQLFRDCDPKVVLAVVGSWWDLSGRFPLPLFEIKCPQCAGPSVIYSQCYFHVRDGSPSRYRADVQCKCATCSFAFVFGVVIPKAMFMAADQMQYNRREIREILGG